MPELARMPGFEPELWESLELEQVADPGFHASGERTDATCIRHLHQSSHSTAHGSFNEHLRGARVQVQWTRRHQLQS